jgi:hypothetical protein
MYQKNAFRVLMGKSEGRIQLEIIRRTWEDKNKTNLREIRWGGLHRICLSQERPVEGSCELDNEPSVSIKWWEIL